MFFFQRSFGIFLLIFHISLRNLALPPSLCLTIWLSCQISWVSPRSLSCSWDVTLWPARTSTAKCDNMAARNRALKSERNRKTQESYSPSALCWEMLLSFTARFENLLTVISLSSGLSQESWLDDLTDIIRDVPCMAPVSLCPPLTPWATWNQNTLMSFPGTACSVEKWWFHSHVL